LWEWFEKKERDLETWREAELAERDWSWKEIPHVVVLYNMLAISDRFGR
jgi:hypothetical protein